MFLAIGQLACSDSKPDPRPHNSEPRTAPVQPKQDAGHTLPADMFGLEKRSKATGSTIDTLVSIDVQVSEPGIVALEITDHVESKLDEKMLFEDEEGTSRSQTSVHYPEQIFLVSAPIEKGNWTIEFSIEHLDEELLGGLVDAMWGKGATQRIGAETGQARGVDRLEVSIFNSQKILRLSANTYLNSPSTPSGDVPCKPGCGASVVRAAGSWPDKESKPSQHPVATAVLIGSWWDADRIPSLPKLPHQAPAPVYRAWLHFVPTSAGAAQRQTTPE